MEHFLTGLVVALALALIAAAAHAKKRANEAQQARAAWAQSALDLAHAKAQHSAGRMSDEDLAKELGSILLRGRDIVDGRKS